LRKGKDATIIACGVMVAEALSAAEKLKAEGMMLKCLICTRSAYRCAGDPDSVKETGALVTAEEHQIYGGLGSAVAEVVLKYTLSD